MNDKKKFSRIKNIIILLFTIIEAIGNIDTIKTIFIDYIIDRF